MTIRTKATAAAITAALTVGAMWALPAARASTTGQPRLCTWGGTPATPTGTFTISPGVTNLPSPTSLALHATGALGGACRGTLTYDGQFDPGASCSVNTFAGRATGLPGIRSFAGVGITVLGPARLYDRDGNVVGSENPELATPENAPHFTDCTTPAGFRGGTFSSVIVLP